MRLLQVALLGGLLLTRAGAQAPPLSSAAQSGSYLGVWIWEVDPVRARDLKLPRGTGVEVTIVRPGSPAEIAGLKPGDVLATYNGLDVESIEQFSRAVRETGAGRAVKIEFYRNGVRQTVTAKIGSLTAAERPGPVAPSRRDSPDVPQSLLTWRSPLLGVDAESVDGQLGAYFGVAQGVLVRSVVQGSPAQRAGLKAGDVIVRVGKFPVSTAAEITLRLRGVTAPTAALSVMRDHRDLTVTVTMSKPEP